MHCNGAVQLSQMREITTHWIWARSGGQKKKQQQMKRSGKQKEQKQNKSKSKCNSNSVVCLRIKWYGSLYACIELAGVLVKSKREKI